MGGWVGATLLGRVVGRSTLVAQIPEQEENSNTAVIVGVVLGTVPFFVAIIVVLLRRAGLLFPKTQAPNDGDTRVDLLYSPTRFACKGSLCT